MRSIESEGDTIDQAIEKALRGLNVAREQVEIEILTGATRGVLGFGGKKARVRATVRAPLVPRLDGFESGVSGMDSRETLPAVERDQPAPGRGLETGTQTPDTEATVPSGAFLVRCKETLESILTHLGVSGVVHIVPASDPGGVLLTISADSGGLLIGRRGQTLDALEYIVNRIVGREEAVPRRVMIDVERYRERRIEHLTQLARRLGEKAKQSGRPVTMNPMSARDRRVVHLALQGETGISTRSEGEGHYRKVIILPAERTRRPPRPKPPAS